MCSTLFSSYPFPPFLLPSFLPSSLPLALAVIQESIPPRPPLPKSYYPLEPSATFPPSAPPLPFDSTAWLRSLGLDDGFLDGEDAQSRKVFGCSCSGPRSTAINLTF